MQIEMLAGEIEAQGSTGEAEGRSMEKAAALEALLVETAARLQRAFGIVA